jgi:hypothetical protein
MDVLAKRGDCGEADAVLSCMNKSIVATASEFIPDNRPYLRAISLHRGESWHKG